MISIVLPSYLGKYKYAADDREQKLKRAIKSVINQRYDDWELLIIADGCDKTVEIARQFKDKRIRILKIDKQPLFSGIPRNVGIEYAKGEWICYLDNDDVFSPDHLLLISEGMEDGFDWLFFNDYIYKNGEFHERSCYLKQYKCGTSNIAHKKNIKSRWEVKNKYGQDDWLFISKIKAESDRFKKIPGEYIVCHIPIKGYDL